MSDWPVQECASGPEEVPGGTVVVMDAACLQRARRLDWRFLLDDPALERVAQLGALEGELPEALRAGCTSLQVFDGPEHAGGDGNGRFDLVVTQRVESGWIERALELLRPGGSLYVEGRLGRAGGATAGVRALRAAGFVDVRAWWPWPDHERCLELAPLDDPAALELALSRRRSGFAARAKLRLAGTLLALGLLPRLVPRFSAIGRRPA